MCKMVKKTIRLLAKQDEQVRALSKSEKMTYNELLQDALTIYFKHRKEMVMEEEYARYYADPKNRKREAKLSNEIWELSRDTFSEARS